MLERARIPGRPIHGSPRPTGPRLSPANTPSVRFPRAAPSEFHVTAIGHASFLLQLGGLNVLTDPMFSDRASPFEWAGPRRHQPPGLGLNALPPIDLVLQSHDHYDHLDLRAARALVDRHPDATWCAPLGVAARLRAAGVARVVERDWWGSARVGTAELTCVPAAHFSGRTPFDRDATLWCGWSVCVEHHRCYFVGDTGLHPTFGEIGKRLGGWDAVLMPIGAYAPRWFMRPVHLDPDEAVEAFDALTGGDRTTPTTMIAMHWGTFPLSDEPPDEPPRRARAAWAASGRDPERLWLLDPGETRSLKNAR